jgi:hypothetical protein
MTDRQPTPIEAIIAEAAYEYVARNERDFVERSGDDLDGLSCVTVDGLVNFLGMAAAIAEALEKAKEEA